MCRLAVIFLLVCLAQVSHAQNTYFVGDEFYAAGNEDMVLPTVSSVEAAMETAEARWRARKGDPTDNMVGISWHQPGHPCREADKTVEYWPIELVLGLPFLPIATVRYSSPDESQNYCHGMFFDIHVNLLEENLGENLGTPGCLVSCGNPINLPARNKFQEEADIAEDLGFIRYYNSRSKKDGFLGKNWSHSYDERISFLSFESGDPVYLQIQRHDGSSVTFADEDGIWRNPSNPQDILKELDDEFGVRVGWEYRRSNSRIVRLFDEMGRLIKIVDEASAQSRLILYASNDPQEPDHKRISSVEMSDGRKLTFTFAEQGRISSITNSEGEVYAYEYDEFGRLTEVSKPDGATTGYRYNEAAFDIDSMRITNLTGIVDEQSNRLATFTYSNDTPIGTAHGAADVWTASQINSTVWFLSTPLGATEARVYTVVKGVYRVSAVVKNCAGCVTDTTSWSYDAQGNISYKTRNGVETSYGLNAKGQEIWRQEVLDSDGKKRLIETDWHESHNVPIEIRTLNAANALVAKSSWIHNARGQILSATQTDPVTAATRTSTTTYCEEDGVTAGTCPRVGLVTSVNGERTDVTDQTTFAYRASDHASCAASPTSCPYRKGDLWKVTNALGHVTETLAYDGAGRPLSMKDANGIVTELTYHPRGWLTSRTVKGATPAEDRITLIDYWPTGLVKRVTQSDGSYTDYVYDPAQRLTDITDSAGNTIHYSLDNAGNRTGEDTRDPSGVLKRTLSRVYDQLGQLQSQSDAYSHAIGYTYDANGNTDVVTDALGRATDDAYDPLNRLTQTIQDIGGIGATTQFQYDAQDNLTRVTDPKGLQTNYTYNGFGDLVQLASPDTGSTTYTYDSAGNRASQTDARAKVQAYTYDALNRLTKITNSPRTYTYDNNNTAVCPTNERFAKGRLTGLTDHSGNTKYCYNRFGDLVRKVQTSNGVALTTRLGYDAAGRLATQTYPDGAVLDAVRDGEGRVVELGVTPNGGTRQIVLTGATYAPFGPSTGWTYGNGRGYVRTLNQNYQPLAIHDSGAGGLSLGFGFDEVGNLTLLQDAAQTANLAQYGYDTLNRLQQTKDGPTGTPIETYGYDATGNRQSVTNAGVATAYTYPAGSHRLNKVGAVVRTYDASGNTTKIGGSARQFVYDASGRMTQVKAGSTVTRNYRYNANGEQTWTYLGTDNVYFVYDEAGHLLGEYASDGSPKQQVLWFGDLPVGVLAGSGAGQQLHYIEPDHLGTPRVVIDGVRNVPIWEWKLTGEAFGATPPNQDPDADGTAFVFDLRFPGQRYDNATGLNYNYFRDYDPAAGRYVQSDPIGLAGGVSTFTYVANTPLTLSDSLGLWIARGTWDRKTNTIVCDGVGGIKLALLPLHPEHVRCGTGECIAEHEESHKTDALSVNPRVCMGKPNGMRVAASGATQEASREQARASEFAAYTRQLACLERKRLEHGCDERCLRTLDEEIRYRRESQNDFR